MVDCGGGDLQLYREWGVSPRVLALKCLHDVNVYLTLLYSLPTMLMSVCNRSFMTRMCWFYLVRWWLVVILVVGVVFLSQNCGPWWGPTNAICHSVNVHGVVVLLAGSGDTSPIHVVIKLFALTGTGNP